jgi:hypothetical protein
LDFESIRLESGCDFCSQLLLLVAMYVGWILSITDWQNFIHQTTGQTPLIYLYYSGIHNYTFTDFLACWVSGFFECSGVFVPEDY